MIPFLRRKVNQTKLQYTFSAIKTWWDVGHPWRTVEGADQQHNAEENDQEVFWPTLTLTDRHSSTADKAKVLSSGK